MVKKISIAVALVLAAIAVAGVFMLPTQASKARSVIISAPQTAIVNEIVSAERASQWLPWAIDPAARPLDAIQSGSEGEPAMTWTGPSGGTGTVTMEGPREDGRIIFRITETNGTEREWRVHVKSIGYYGFRVILEEQATLSGLVPRALTMLGVDRHGRDLERALSLLRGQVLTVFGAEGGSFVPAGFRSYETCQPNGPC